MRFTHIIIDNEASITPSVHKNEPATPLSDQRNKMNIPHSDKSTPVKALKIAESPKISQVCPNNKL